MSRQRKRHILTTSYTCIIKAPEEIVLTLISVAVATCRFFFVDQRLKEIEAACANMTPTADTADQQVTQISQFHAKI